MRGSSSVFATGTVENLKLRVSGSSGFEGVYFQSQEADISLSGSSRISLAVSESISGKASGSSDMTVYGSPNADKFSKSDSTTVRIVRR